jgi:plasmid maintenance system antidote protein VapI
MTTTPIPTAGEVLGQRLRDIGLSQTEGASQLGITRQYLNGIINGKYPLTSELLLKINPLLQTSNSYWTEVEQKRLQYDTSPVGKADALRRSMEDQSLQLDLRGDHTLVNSEIEALIDSGYLQLGISADLARERIEATTYLCSVGASGWIEAVGGQERRPVSFLGKGITLNRGMIVTLSTQEVLPRLARMRVHVVGLSESWSSTFHQHFHSGIIEPGMAGPISFSIMNHGPYSFTLKTGDPILRIGFEHLSQEPASPPDELLT